MVLSSIFPSLPCRHPGMTPAVAAPSFGEGCAQGPPTFVVAWLSLAQLRFLATSAHPLANGSGLRL